jgi:hypothetical protein
MFAFRHCEVKTQTVCFRKVSGGRRIMNLSNILYPESFGEYSRLKNPCQVYKIKIAVVAVEDM